MPDITIEGDQVSLTLQILLSELEAEADKLIDDLNVQHLNNLQNGLSRQESLNEILDTIRNNVPGSVYNSFRNRTNTRIRQQIKASIAKPAIIHGQNEPDILYEWNLTDEAEHCSTCLEASRQGPHTLDWWKNSSYGLPRQDAELKECSWGCRCYFTIHDGE